MTASNREATSCGITGRPACGPGGGRSAGPGAPGLAFGAVRYPVDAAAAPDVHRLHVLHGDAEHDGGGGEALGLPFAPVAAVPLKGGGCGAVDLRFDCARQT